MPERIEDLKPQALWRAFAGISKVPRCSKHEAAAIDWLERLGREKGCATRRDAVGNLVIAVPASPGREKAPTVVLQGHADMVCEKNADVAHDFSRDPIRPRIEGEWVKATGTTLGADNAIGFCTALALLDTPEALHGPLEILITVDEETGLTGATNIAPGFITGKYLINLDSEEIGVFTVGCAGGRDSLITLRAPREKSSDAEAFQVKVSGLMGGHSGTDIHENRGNSIRILALLLQALLDDPEAGEIRLGRFTGGSKRNAIPREASAVVAVKRGRSGPLKAAVERIGAQVHAEHAGIESGWQISLDALPSGAEPLASAADSRRMIGLLNALPNGVQAMSVALRTLVETSNNVGVVEDLGDGWKVVCASRSSLAPAMESLIQRIRATAKLAGAEVSHGDGYPGWKPDLDSPLLSRAREVYRRLYGTEAEVRAIHAGLECGLFTEKYPELDLLSYGPDIKGAHSPDERVRISTVEKMWEFTCALLEDLSRPRA